MKKIAIMGGTFNPIHYGHLMLAEAVRSELRLDEVWMIPTGCSYLKREQRELEPGMPTPQERLYMTQLAVQGYTDYRVLDTEVRRPGYTYTCETLETLHAEYPDCEFYLILGADCMEQIEHWERPDEIFANAHVVAAGRGDITADSLQETLEHLREKFSADILPLRFRDLELSSSEIRSRIAAERSVRFMLPDKVLDYITERNFYRKTCYGAEKNSEAVGEKSGRKAL